MMNNIIIQRKFFLGILMVLLPLLLFNCSTQQKNTTASSTKNQERTVASACSFDGYTPCHSRLRELCCPSKLHCPKGQYYTQGICKVLNEEEKKELKRTCFIEVDANDKITLVTTQKSDSKIFDITDENLGRDLLAHFNEQLFAHVIRAYSGVVYDNHICDKGQWIKFCLYNDRPFPEGAKFFIPSRRYESICKDGEFIIICPDGLVPCDKNKDSCCHGPEDDSDYDNQNVSQ